MSDRENARLCGQILDGLHAATVWRGGRQYNRNSELPPDWPKGDIWWAVYDRCETPIEQIMCIYLRQFGGTPIMPGTGDASFPAAKAIAETQDRKRVTLVFSQTLVGKYRVDFVLVRYDLNRDHFRRMIVECDGHYFHQSSRALQDRDVFRDTELVKVIPMVRIIHVPGSEIYRRPEVCAAEIDNALG